jgi:hypothetical protein
MVFLQSLFFKLISFLKSRNHTIYSVSQAAEAYRIIADWNFRPDCLTEVGEPNKHEGLAKRVESHERLELSHNSPKS